MLAEPLRVCAARLALQQQVGLRRIGDPAAERLCHFGRLRRRIVQERVDQGGIDVTRDVERQVPGGERFGRGIVGLVERGADGAGRKQLAAQLRECLGFQRQRHPATAEVCEQRVDRARRVGVAQMRLEQRRPFGEERPDQHAGIGVVHVDVVEVAEHAGADASARPRGPCSPRLQKAASRTLHRNRWHVPTPRCRYPRHRPARARERSL